MGNLSSSPKEAMGKTGMIRRKHLPSTENFLAKPLVNLIALQKKPWANWDDQEKLLPNTEDFFVKPWVDLVALLKKPWANWDDQ